MKKLIPVAAFLCLLVIQPACSGKTQTPEEKRAKAKADFERACTVCHKAEVALSKTKTTEQWKETVHRMRVKGAAVTEEEGQNIAEYLHSVGPG